MDIIIELLEYFFASTGSTWISEKELQKIAKKKDISLAPLPAMEKDKSIRFTVMREKKGSVKYYTTPKFYLWESLVAFHICRIMESYPIFHPETFTEEEIDRYLAYARLDTNVRLGEEQRKAVITGVNNGFCIITGGPGTGKTSTLTTLIHVLRQINPDLDVRFTSPTGKASRRITESTKEPAKTVQKELGISPDNPERYMFTGDVLVIDEVSMLDLETAVQCFQAVGDGRKVILLGDIDQLPSVGPGSILRDLIFSDVVPKMMLEKAYRQEDGSMLAGNIARIKNGDAEMGQSHDFESVIAKKNPTKQLIDLFMREVKQWGVDNVACLLPYRKAGNLCSNKINVFLQEKINPTNSQKPALWVEKCEDGGKPRRVCFMVNDPVMQLVNRRECANGDVGKVIKVSGQTIDVRYADCCVQYTESEAAKELELAYAMSINKSQGSEYKSVIVAITNEHKQMLQRNLLYTGVTRAKKKCTLLYEPSALRIAIKNEEQYKRETMLAELLQREYRINTFKKIIA